MKIISVAFSILHHQYTSRQSYRSEFNFAPLRILLFRMKNVWFRFHLITNVAIELIEMRMDSKIKESKNVEKSSSVSVFQIFWWLLLVVCSLYFFLESSFFFRWMEAKKNWKWNDQHCLLKQTTNYSKPIEIIDDNRHMYNEWWHFFRKTWHRTMPKLQIFVFWTKADNIMEFMKFTSFFLAPHSELARFVSLCLARRYVSSLILAVDFAITLNYYYIGKWGSVQIHAFNHVHISLHIPNTRTSAKWISIPIHVQLYATVKSNYANFNETESTSGPSNCFWCQKFSSSLCDICVVSLCARYCLGFLFIHLMSHHCLFLLCSLYKHNALDTQSVIAKREICWLLAKCFVWVNVYSLSRLIHR